MMKKETRIILELTPREAAVIHDFVLTCSWRQGSYCIEVKNIYNALSSVSAEFENFEPIVCYDDGDAIDINEINMD